MVPESGVVAEPVLAVDQVFELAAGMHIKYLTISQSISDT